MSDSEWFGEPHTLIVHTVTPPDGPFDDGELEYDIEHPSSCEQEDDTWGDVTATRWACDVAQHITDGGLEFSLNYSGTPITEPGTYRIQGWGRKTYYFDSGYEYDGGIGVMDPEASE